MDKKTLLALTTDIVSAHASQNELTQEQLLAEIQNVFAKLAGLSGDPAVATAAVEVPDAEDAEAAPPAVPLEAAFGRDKVFCMVCGKGMKTLKRHLATAHDLKPGAYRRRFGIPAGTPLVAKSYSEARKKMAQDLNLGERLVEARAAKSRKAKK